jgi:acylphosphatase
MASSQRRYVVRFIGHVQGVCFRATCLHQASGLRVNGFVRNEADGSVLLDVDGELSELKELVARIRSAMTENISEIVLDKRDSLQRSDGFHIAW